MAIPRSLRVAAWLQITFGALGIVGAAMVATLVRGSSPTHSATTPFLFLAMALLAPAIGSGVLVLRGHRHALLALTMVARLQMFLVPVGTALGAYSAWAVRRATEPIDAPANGQPARPPMELLPDVERTAPLLAVVAAVGAGFVLVIALGFRISGDSLPADCDGVLAVGFAILSTIAAIAWRGLATRRERERERLSASRR